ncbi:MAG TPA: glutamine--tRNA ligase/YqeY domain fusion protein [Bacteroidales bacterium]|nr:glutamine--tRNA ligase/YqeY domain fusion protein [Bacteroidales bacterium]
MENNDTPKNPRPSSEGKSLNFIEQIIEEDIAKGKNESRVHTRFPPEPNGYLHIGHAKSICLNFGLAKKYNGKCNLRFDDTNPTKEDTEYVDSIKEDVRWLGFEWAGEYYASDYFETLYEYAVKLIRKGKAYVCDMTQEEIGASRGTITKPGLESPFRKRSVEENIELFQRMRQGDFADGEKVLRAKIDMASPNMLMRDPILYRILHAEHHRTGNKWCIYPMYDFAHGQCDSIEGITHSVCTLEFEVHRPLYDWFIRELEIYAPQQIEFARLNLSYTVMSKRKLLSLVQEKIVKGWDDPRMPTICGLRRRGYTPEALQNFAETIGVARRDNVIDVSLLEYCLREDLNKKAQRLLAVVNPVKLILTNYPENQEEELEAVNNPENPDAGMRKIPFSRELYIEQEDFMEVPAPKYFRLFPGNEVRLKYAYIVRCENVIKNDDGTIKEIHGTYDVNTRSGMPDSNRKVKATIHWVSAQHAVAAEARIYDKLFTQLEPENVPEGEDFKSNLNPDSLKITQCWAEPFVKKVKPGDKLQFERVGYFCVDADTTPGHIVLNKTVGLKGAWQAPK